MTATNPVAEPGKTITGWRSRLIALTTDAWKWWIGELAECVPARLRQRIAGTQVHMLLILDAAGDNLIQETGNGRRSLGRIDFDAPPDRAILASLPRAGKDGRLPVAIRLDARHALRATASLPLAAERNLAQVIGFEFERLVPFRKTDVYYTYRVTTRDKAAQRLALELTVVPHAELAKIVDLLPRLGLQPTELQVTGLGVDVPTATITLASATPLEQGRGNHRVVVIALAALAGVLAIACVAIPLWRADTAIAALNVQIADAREQAQTSANLQKQIESTSHDQQFLVDRKRASPSVTELLAALTQLLPDDTYLTELDVRGDQIRLIGVTGSATALLTLIDKSPSFRDASFESSITQDARTNRERFDIGARIAQRGRKP